MQNLGVSIIPTLTSCRTHNAKLPGLSKRLQHHAICYCDCLSLVFCICLLQVKQDVITKNSEETGEFDNLVDLEALLDDDVFMPTAT